MRRYAFAVCLTACALSYGAPVRPARVYDLLEVKWSIALDTDHHVIAGDVVNFLTPLQDGTKDVWFDCGPLNISAVTVDGAKADFKLEGEKLTVTLPKVAGSHDKLAVRIQYSGQPSAGVYFVDAKHASPSKYGMVYTQGEMVDTRYWLPTYDWPDDKVVIDGTVIVPDGQLVLSNGKLMDKKTINGQTAFHWRMEEPQSTYLISFVAGNYQMVQEMWNHMPVQFYVPKGLAEQGTAAFSGTNKMIDFYSKLTGFNYPYAKFAQSAVADYMFGGMENTSCVTQTIGTLHPLRTEPLANSSGLVAHELAHQWFGDTVTCSDWSHAWLNEGFATFLPHFWIRQSQGQEAYDMSRFDTLNGALGSERGSQIPVVYPGYDEPIDMFGGQIYGGGAARMFMLMNEVGEKAFWKGVESYLNEYKFKNVDTEKFFAAMSKSTGKDLTPFMKTWLYGLAAPNLKVSHQGSKLVIDQGNGPLVDIHTFAGILTPGGMVRMAIEIKDKVTEVDLGSYGISPAVVDPDADYMLDVTYDKPFTSDQLFGLFKGVGAGGKLRLLPMVSDALTGDLFESLVKQQSIPVQLRMIPYLKDSSASYIMELANSSEKRIEAAAVDRLGRLPKSDANIARLTQIWKTDYNDVLRNSALSALLNLTNDEGLAAEAFGMDSYQDDYRRTVLGYWFNTNKDLAREKCLTILQYPSTEQIRVDAINRLGQLKDKPGERTVFEALTHVVQESTFGARRTAIGALADYGDAAAIPFIEPNTKSSLHFMRRAAVAAIRRLKK